VEEIWVDIEWLEVVAVVVDHLKRGLEETTLIMKMSGKIFCFQDFVS
jgi:hypothetical protein